MGKRIVRIELGGAFVSIIRSNPYVFLGIHHVSDLRPIFPSPDSDAGKKGNSRYEIR